MAYLDPNDYDSFTAWSNAKKKKKKEEEEKKESNLDPKNYNSFTEWSNAKHGKSKEDIAPSRVSDRLSSLSSVTAAEDFEEKSAYKSTKKDNWLSRIFTEEFMGYDDLAYEYINNSDGKIRSRIAATQNTNMGLTGTSIDGVRNFAEAGYDYITADEVKIYNYLYATQGKKKAEEYLGSLSEDLVTRKAQSDFTEYKGNTAREILKGVDIGLNQFETGIKNAADMVTGQDDYIVPTSKAILGGMIREDLADDSIPIWYNFKDKKWENEAFGATAGQIAYDSVTTAANMAPSMMAGMVNPVAGVALLGGSATGNAYQEKLNEGYDPKQAKLYATGIGVLEGTLQYALGGIGKLGGASKYISKAVSGIDNALARFSLEFAGRIGSEAMEEGLQEVLDPLLQRAVFDNDAEINWEDVAYSALLGGLMGATMGGGESSGLSHSEQQVVNKVYETEIAARESDGKKVTSKDKNKIYESVVEQMERGDIPTEVIEDVLGGESYKTHRDTVTREDALRQEYKELGGLEKPTLAQQTRYQELHNSRDTFANDDMRNDLRSKAKDEVRNRVRGTRLEQSYLEEERVHQKLDLDVSKYDGVARKTVENAIRSGANNTAKSRSFVEFSAKISEDTGLEVGYGTDKDFEATRVKLDVDRVNESVSRTKITLNTDSEYALNDLLGHAITHKLEKEKHYAKLQKAYKDFIGEEAYNAMLLEKSDTYKNAKGSSADNEITATLSGKYLFTDEKFIKKLSVEHQDVFHYVLNEIKHWIKMATAGSKEARQLEQIQHLYLKCYREAFAEKKAQAQTASANTANGKTNITEIHEAIAPSAQNNPSTALDKAVADYVENGIDDVKTDLSNSKEANFFAGYRKAYVRQLSDGRYESGVEGTQGNGQFVPNDNVIRTGTLEEALEAQYRYMLENGGEEGSRMIQKHADKYDEAHTDYFLVGKNANGQDVYTANEDIRFSLSNVVEETKDLMALHNMKASELVKTLELGGLPMPSIAVIKDNMSHEDYGDVSLILPKEAIDPAANKDNKVYGGDAWTPTYPKIEYKPNEKVEKKIRDKYYELTRVIGYDEVRPMYRYVNELEETLNRDGGEAPMLEKLYDDTGMMNLYLQDSGKGKIEPITRETVTKISDAQAEKNQWFIDALGKDFVASFKALDGVIPMKHRSAFMEQHEEKIRDAYKRYFAEEYGFTPEEIENVFENISRRDLMAIMRDAYQYTQNNGVTVRTETDYSATDDAIREAAKDGYKEWVDGLFKGIEGKSGIRNNQDYYTRSGNPRSWDALHWENTLENVIKVMKGQDETGVGSFSPFNTLFGASHKRYGNIQEIKADSDRLGKINQDEYDAMKDEFSNRFASIAESIKDPAERNPFIATDTAAEQIIEAVRTKKTKTGILNHLKSLNSRATMQTVDDVLSLVSDIANMPTGYFEAKPKRAVSLDEVGVFVIPRNADVKLKQELLNRGYNIAEYDPDVEGDRQKVVNQFEEYKFSLSDAGKQGSDGMPDPVGNYYVYGRDIKYKPLEEDVAPVGEDVAPTAEAATEAPSPNEIAPMTEEEANALQDEKAQADAAAEGLPKSRKQLHNNILNDIKATFSSGGFDFDDVLSKAKNLSTFSTVDNTPQRVMEKALGYKEGQTLADLTVNKVAQNETAGIKWLNSFTDRKNGLLAQISKQYRIKPGSKESAAAQMYAEGFYVNDNNDIIAYGDAELAKDFPDVGVQDRIKGLAHDPRIRQIYDDTLNAINESRTRNAYPEIQRLENYFLHFRAMDDTFSRLGLPFNPNDIRAKDLPTDLNGVTADLKPGQPYFASAMHRTGKRTSFDLLGGLERYLTSAKNQIYHIDDIQTLRALRNYIADTYGQANGLEGIDALSEEAAQEKIEQVYNSHLSTFAKFLNEEANVLAGKTALIDRGLEGVIGRRGMTFLDTVNRQVGSNMVGFNVSSSLTNFLPVAQTFAKTNKFDFTKAFAQTVSNKLGSVFGKSDGFAENSPVVIRRKGADRFYRTPWQKAGDAGYFLMSAVDDISTELIARTKYNELTRKGMDEQTAHFETDKWVSRLMGDRSLGQQPQVYNSKTLGVLTKFQLEVRNQLDSQFYDTIQEAKVSNEDIQNALARNAKTAAKVASTFVQLAVAQHLYGKAFESVAGYNPAFDIIETLSTMFGFDDEEDSEDTVLDNVEQGFLALLEDLPYTSTFTGGRIPIASALPITELIKGVDQYGNEKSRLETIKGAAPYYILPGGYGQIKKTRQGLGMFSDEHPVSGSYTNSGNLRFPVEDTPLNKAQAAIFGQYASQNAREYFDNDYAPLNEKQIQEYIDVDLPVKDYREYREGLKGLDKVEDKFDYIAGLDLPIDKKNILVNNVVDRKESVDLEGYEDFSGYEEFDFATKNPEKWDFLQANNITYAEYNASKESREAYNWAANNPEGYAVSKAVADDVVTYKQYTSDLYDIKADKDKNGKSISGSRKEKVIDYINNLDADYHTKIILLKSEYPSVDDYNSDIVDYIINREDFTYEERVMILTELGFRVAADGRIYAD